MIQQYLLLNSVQRPPNQEYKFEGFFAALTKKIIQNSDEMEASTESVTTDVDLLTEALSTASSTTINEESCSMQIQLNQSQSNFSGCPVVNDTILCWPRTLPNTTAILPCFTQYLGINYDGSQNASRFCYANGTWDSHANYDQCRHIEDDITDGMDPGKSELAPHIYSAGYTLSLVALSLGLAVFIHFKDLRCLRNTIHANLFLTYILSALLWIIPFTLGLTANELTGVGCKCMVILLHYFSLTNFFWMLVEGLYLYMLVVETFSGDNIRLKMYAFIGWGCPAIIIAIWTSVKPFVPDVDEMNRKRIPMKCTWLQESYADWIFHGPEVACLLINLFFLIRIMWVLIIKLRSATTAETRQYKKASKALLVLIPLLGITYLVVWYVPENGAASDTLDAIRAALLSTQGFSVALLYCFLNSEVKQALHHRITIWREKRNIGMDTQMDYRKHRNGLSKEYSSPRSRTESIRLTSNGSSMP